MNKKILPLAMIVIFLLSVFAMRIDKAYGSPSTNAVGIYFHHTGGVYRMNTTKSWNTTGTSTQLVASADNSTFHNASWVLSPTLAGVLTTTSITSNIWIRANTDDAYGSLEFKFYNGTDYTALNQTMGCNVTLSHCHFNWTATKWTTPATAVALALPASNQIIVDIGIITNNNNSAIEYYLYYDTATYDSGIVLTCTSHISATAIYLQTPKEDVYMFNQAFTINVTVHDDFGIYDVATVYIWFRPQGQAVSLPSAGLAITASSSNVATANTGTWTYALISIASDITSDTSYYNAQWTIVASDVDNVGDVGGDNAYARTGGPESSDDYKMTSQAQPYIKHDINTPPLDTTGNETLAFFYINVLGLPVYIWFIAGIMITTVAVVMFVAVSGKKIKIRKHGR